MLVGPAPAANRHQLSAAQHGGPAAHDDAAVGVCGRAVGGVQYHPGVQCRAAGAAADLDDAELDHVDPVLSL